MTDKMISIEDENTWNNFKLICNMKGTTAKEVYNKKLSFNKDIIEAQFIGVNNSVKLIKSSKPLVKRADVQEGIEYRVIKNGKKLKRTVIGWGRRGERPSDRKFLENAKRGGVKQEIFKYEDNVQLIPVRKVFINIKRT